MIAQLDPLTANIVLAGAAAYAAYRAYKRVTNPTKIPNADTVDLLTDPRALLAWSSVGLFLLAGLFAVGLTAWVVGRFVQYLEWAARPETSPTLLTGISPAAQYAVDGSLWVVPLILFLTVVFVVGTTYAGRVELLDDYPHGDGETWATEMVREVNHEMEQDSAENNTVQTPTAERDDDHTLRER